MAESQQPIVIFGGFMSSPVVYRGMQAALARTARVPVEIVGVYSVHWLAGTLPVGWIVLLQKLDQVVRRAARGSDTGKVTLVGHSMGGVLARIYLSPEPFMGRSYRGLDRVDRLVTLGSPHYNLRAWLHGGAMARWAERHCPGACLAPDVCYVSVAGKVIQGCRDGSLWQRHAHEFYRQIVGNGDVWGDGVVPVSSALLDGSRRITLEGVSHFAGMGGPWYGAEQVLPSWWSASLARD